MADPIGLHADLTYRIIGHAMRVHRLLGPGLLESAYQKCLCLEFHRAGLPFESQLPLRTTFEGIEIDCGYTGDLVVADQVILELKSVEKLLPVHKAQLLTYLRLSPYRVGLLINFNTVSLTDGIQRCVL